MIKTLMIFFLHCQPFVNYY